MARAPREPTRWPGVYKRGAKYEFIWRDANGRQRSATRPTLDRARRDKAKFEDEAATGHIHDASLTLAIYALDWIDRYQGRTTRGFRENSRKEYRRHLTAYALEFFGERQTMATLTPRRISSFVSWLALYNIGTEANPRVMSDASIRRIMAPLKACLATAVEEGVIPTNPTAGVRLPNRPKIEEDDEQAKALTEDELEALLLCAPQAHRLLLGFLAATGLRISEASALQWKHLILNGDRPHVRVRRAYVKGEYGPPKSRKGRRSVPLDPCLVAELRTLKRRSEFTGSDDLVFCQLDGSQWETSKLRAASIEVAGPEAGVAWAGFHTLRHTCATRLFAHGRNAVQVSNWLGHHSPAFTLSVYVHLLNDDLGAPLPLPGRGDAWLGDSRGTAEAHETDGNELVV